MKIHLDPPQNLASDFEPIYAAQDYYVADADLALSYFKKPVFFTRSGIGLKNFSLISASIIPHIPRFRKQYLRYALAQYFLRPVQRLKDPPYLLIHNHWSEGYHHWLLESLVRLIQIPDADLKKYTLILPERYRGFQMDSLRPFEFKAIHWVPDRQNLRIPELTLPQNPRSGAYNPRFTKALRTRYWQALSNYDIALPTSSKRIYISRQKAKSRKILNEEALMDILKNYDFEVLAFEELNFWQQVRLMKNCHCLISVHGAGLSNMVFMPPGGQVLEIYNAALSQRYFNSCYWSLAQVSEQQYFYQFASADSAESNADLQVDLLKFAENLQKMLPHG